MVKQVELFNGDCLAAMLFMADNSRDSIVCDPPYGLSFMGNHWDYDVPSVEIWRECLRVLKPGGYLLAFAGARTHHRMACAIEDAGFEIRDMIAWVYGQGFPKHKSALKPALEPITLARKPAPRATLLNIDACRVPAEKPTGWGGGGSALYDVGLSKMGGEARPVEGRYPANLVHDGSPEVLAGFPDSDGCGGSVPQVKITGYGGGIGSGASEYLGGERRRVECGSGSAARFFYAAPFADDELGADPIIYCKKANKKDRGEGNTHPTVKPQALMRYLLRLVTPPGGLTFDPFLGSGTTGVAAVLEGFRFSGAERDADSFAIAERRIAQALAEVCRP